VKLFSSFYTKKDKASEILNITGLEAKRKSYVENLSGGQRQKACSKHCASFMIRKF
jgi:ABC-type methionine transport system ATPase subunit